MADTGAPWNIPYAEPTDLVRDWPALSEDVADAVADALDSVVTAGIGSNVVQTVLDSAFSTSTTGSYVAVTGLTVTITPTSNTSKVAVFLSTHFGSSSTSSDLSYRLVRGSTPIAQSSFGTSAVTTGSTFFTNIDMINPASMVFLDSPGTDTATTYSVEIRAFDGTSYVNRRGRDTAFGTISTLTAVEVEA